jgi:hypothetical protein
MLTQTNISAAQACDTNHMSRERCWNELWQGKTDEIESKLVQLGMSGPQNTYDELQS